MRYDALMPIGLRHSAKYPMITAWLVWATLKCDLKRRETMWWGNVRNTPQTVTFWGNAAVNFFVLTSGFVTHWAYADRLTSCDAGELRRFFVRRRIFFHTFSVFPSFSNLSCFTMPLWKNFVALLPGLDMSMPYFNLLQKTNEWPGTQAQESNWPFTSSFIWNSLWTRNDILICGMSRNDLEWLYTLSLNKLHNVKADSRMGRVVLTTWVAMLLGLSVLLVQLRGDMPVPWRG